MAIGSNAAILIAEIRRRRIDLFEKMQHYLRLGLLLGRRPANTLRDLRAPNATKREYCSRASCTDAFQADDFGTPTVIAARRGGRPKGVSSGQPAVPTALMYDLCYTPPEEGYPRACRPGESWSCRILR